MKIFCKALFKSLTQKKARTALVLFSIAVAASLMFANECFSRVCAQKFYEADVRVGGNSDVRMETKQTVGAEEWIDIQKLSKYQSQFNYLYQFIKEKALYAPSVESMHYFTLIGADIGEFNAYNPLTLTSGSFDDFTGFRVIVGPSYAQKYNLKVNDTMQLELNGNVYDFKVSGISAAKGQYVRELADGGYLIAPKATIAKIFGGGSNYLFLKLKDSSQKEVMFNKFTEEFPEYNVNYGVNDMVIAAETANYVMPFRIAAVAVIFMSMFIIFSAFSLFTMERIPLIGTLRSVGYTRKRINRLLLLESFLFGAAGGVLGCLMGFGVLQIITSTYFANDAAFVNPFSMLLSPAPIIAIGTATVITVLSAILPILRITKTPIRNIILNDVRKKQGRRTRLWIAGIVLMLLCAVVPQFLKTNLAGMITSNAVATGALLGMIPLIPFLTYHVSRLVSRLPFVPYDVALGVRNVHDSRGLLNNVQLFAAAIAIVAFMTSIFNSMNSDLIKAYEKDMRYDIELILRHTDGQVSASLSKINGVQDAFGNYMTDADITNYNTFFNMVYGIDGSRAFDFNSVGLVDGNKEAIANLNNGKNIITTTILRDKLGLKLGDKLMLRFGSKEVAYTVTGFMETNLGIGHVGYVSIDNFKQDSGITDIHSIYIKTNMAPSAVKINILRAMTKDVMSISTKSELLAANSDKVVPVFHAISVYSYIALAVGLIGIINNLAAAFLERKRSFALLRSIGMSRKNLNRMLTAEAMAMGIHGTVFGLAAACVMSRTIPTLVGVFWGKVAAAPAFGQMAVMGIAGVLAMLAIAAIPVLESRRLSIMESIRYE